MEERIPAAARLIHHEFQVTQEHLIWREERDTTDWRFFYFCRSHVKYKPVLAIVDGVWFWIPSRTSCCGEALLFFPNLMSNFIKNRTISLARRTTPPRGPCATLLMT